MRRQGIMGVLNVAGATMVFTLVSLGAWKAGVSDESTGIKPQIFPPTFTAMGCEFVLKTDKAEYTTGETPVVEIEAANTSGKSVETTVWINITAADVPSPMSRVMAMPQTLWSQSWTVSLEPGEKKAAKMTTTATLRDRQNISITLSDRERAVMAREFPVGRNIGPTQAAQPMAVPANAKAAAQ